VVHLDDEAEQESTMSRTTRETHPRTTDRRRPQLAVALAAATLLLGACGGITAPAGGSSAQPSGSAGGADASAAAHTAHAVVPDAAALLPADAKSKGTLTVATGEGYPPFEFYAADNTTLQGVDPELVTVVAESLGLKPDFKVLKFDAIIPGLQGGRYDAAAAAMGITPTRNKVVDFVSYFQGGTSIMFPTGNPLKLSLDTMCGHKIAVQKGTIYATDYMPTFAKKCTDGGQPDITIDTYPDQPSAALAVSSGRADATMDDFGPLAYVAKQSNGKFEVLDANYSPAPYGIALPKGSALAPAVEKALEALVADGTYGKVLDEWGVSAGAIKDPAVSRG
jgi:polar amino acid transport system substrate-binding protein